MIAMLERATALDHFVALQFSVYNTLNMKYKDRAFAQLSQTSGIRLSAPHVLWMSMTKFRSQIVWRHLLLDTLAFPSSAEHDGATVF